MLFIPGQLSQQVSVDFGVRQLNLITATYFDHTKAKKVAALLTNVRNLG